MKKKIVIIPETTFIYMRFSKEEQFDNNIIYLTKSEAIDLYKELQKKIFKVPYASLLGDDV